MITDHKQPFTIITKAYIHPPYIQHRWYDKLLTKEYVATKY